MNGSVSGLCRMEEWLEERQELEEKREGNVVKSGGTEYVVDSFCFFSDYCEWYFRFN